MSTNFKDFVVDGDLYVNDAAVFDSNFVIGQIPLSVDSNNRLQINVNNTWKPIAFLSDTETINFSNQSINLEYDGGN